MKLIPGKQLFVAAFVAVGTLFILIEIFSNIIAFIF